MGFELTIAEGKETGKQLLFEQPSVLVGRTDECDVVLYDPGVSRVHCRIFADGPGYAVEDMGSSNGTQVNGQDVKRHPLKSGDAIKLGPVVFRFVEEQEEKTQIGALPDLAEPSIEEENTRIFQPGEARKSRVAALQAAVTAPPSPLGASISEVPNLFEDFVPLEEDKTNIKPMPVRPPAPAALSVPSLEADEEAGGSEDKTTIRPLPTRPSGPSSPPRLSAGSGAGASSARGATSPSALARASGSTSGSDLAPRSSSPRAPVPRTSRPSQPSLSASERARIRRESAGAGGALKVWWMEASAGARSALVASLVLLLLVGVGGAGFLLLGQTTKGPNVKEPVALASTPLEASFGVGPGVTFVHANQKLFEFEFNSAVRVVAVLHYQAKDISEGEVNITVNGASLGSVPPDTMNSDTRPLEVIIPSNLLKKGEKNRILFVTAHRTPETWRIWNLWVETAPLPEVSPEQLVRNATELYKQGVQAVDGQNIDKRNRYRAWKYFRTAWLMLEGHPDPKPELYRLARDRMRSAQTELDNQCSKLLLEAEREFNHHDLGAANQTLNEVQYWFLGRDQPCPLRAEWTREKYGIL